MKHPTPVTALLTGAFLIGALLAGVAPSSQAAEGYAPIQPVQSCLDPSRARSWTLLDSSRLLVDAGRKQYLFELAWSCPELATEPTLQFHSRSPHGRICGAIGDRVRGSGTVPSQLPPGQEAGCQISRARLLSREEYDAELRARRPGKSEPISDE